MIPSQQLDLKTATQGDHPWWERAKIPTTLIYTAWVACYAAFLHLVTNKGIVISVISAVFWPAGLVACLVIFVLTCTIIMGILIPLGHWITETARAVTGGFFGLIVVVKTNAYLLSNMMEDPTYAVAWSIALCSSLLIAIFTVTLSPLPYDMMDSDPIDNTDFSWQKPSTQ